MFPVPIARVGFRAVAAVVTALALCAAPAVSSSASACVAGDLSATYTLVPFSNGLGHVSYVLTVANRSSSACVLTAPMPVQLLDRHRHPLPTNARTFPPGTYHLTLARKQWAQADGRFSPDIPGPGEGSPQCEPDAHFLRLTIGHGTVTAPMDPTPVCGHGSTAFNRLSAVAPSAPCAASALSASFKRDAPPSRGQVDYSLLLRNHHQRCHTSSVLALRLLGAGGSQLPTQVVAGVASPFVVPPGVKELAVAVLRTTAGPGEPHHGACEPLASLVRISPRPGSGSLTVPVQPGLHACHRGLIGLSTLGQTG